tara:strand:+ start:33 stop:287 length:255 start_codon:yes stop_codon:yes gene_type:complete
VPRYQYRCSHCKTLNTLFHLSEERATDCPACGSEKTLTKALTTFTTSSRAKKKEKVGTVTEEFIEEARVDLKKQHAALDKGRKC